MLLLSKCKPKSHTILEKSSPSSTRNRSREWYYKARKSPVLILHWEEQETGRKMNREKNINSSLLEVSYLHVVLLIT